MGRGKIEKFGLKAITDALDGSDVLAARDSLSQLVGAVMEVSGKVLKPLYWGFSFTKIKSLFLSFLSSKIGKSRIW
jgi:hypothetical protein